MQARLDKEQHINQLELHRLKLTASAERLQDLSSAAELTLHTQLAEAEISLAQKQSELRDITAQLQDYREVLAALQQVITSAYQPADYCPGTVLQSNNPQLHAIST